MVGLLGERMKLRACFARFYRPHPGGPSCIKASEHQQSGSVGSQSEVGSGRVHLESDRVEVWYSRIAVYRQFL